MKMKQHPLRSKNLIAGKEKSCDHLRVSKEDAFWKQGKSPQPERNTQAGLSIGNKQLEHSAATQNNKKDASTMSVEFPLLKFAKVDFGCQTVSHDMDTDQRDLTQSLQQFSNIKADQFAVSCAPVKEDYFR